MNIEKIFNDANNKEICKYVLYTKSQDGYMNPMYDLYVDEECKKLLTYELVKPADDDKKDAEFLKNLEMIFNKGVIVKALDSDKNVVAIAPVFDYRINASSLFLRVLTVTKDSSNNVVLTTIPYSITIR